MRVPYRQKVERSDPIKEKTWRAKNLLLYDMEIPDFTQVQREEFKIDVDILCAVETTTP